MKLTYTVIGFIMLWVADIGAAIAMTAVALASGEYIFLLVSMLCLGCAAILLGFLQDLQKNYGGGP
jgi:hypothetical protein